MVEALFTKAVEDRVVILKGEEASKEKPQNPIGSRYHYFGTPPNGSDVMLHLAQKISNRARGFNISAITSAVRSSNLAQRTPEKVRNEVCRELVKVSMNLGLAS